MPCLAQRTHAKGLWVAHSLPKDLLNSAFLDTEVLHRTYTGRTLQSRAPHSSACSSAALASASSAASGSLRDACFSASNVASFIVRTVLSLLQQPPRHTRPNSHSGRRSGVMDGDSKAAARLVRVHTPHAVLRNCLHRPLPHLSIFAYSFRYHGRPGPTRRRLRRLVLRLHLERHRRSAAAHVQAAMVRAG